MLFTWSCQCKNLSIFIPSYFTEFDGYNLFPLIFISSRSTFVGDLKIASSVNLCSTNYSSVSYGWFAYLDFLQTYLYEKDLYHQQSDALCRIELPCGDH